MPIPALCYPLEMTYVRSRPQRWYRGGPIDGPSRSIRYCGPRWQDCEHRADDRRIDGRTVLCVLTHDAKFDIPLLKTALNLDVAFVGAMGSRRSHRQRLTRPLLLVRLEARDAHRPQSERAHHEWELPASTVPNALQKRRRQSRERHRTTQR